MVKAPEPASTRTRIKKLRRLPANVRVEKRPLIRPSIPPPNAGKKSAKIVFVGSNTPFVSALQRVKKLLHRIEQREIQSDLALSKHRRPAPRETKLESEPVFIKGTGKSIEKVLGLALALQKSDLSVEIRTGTVAAVDDLVEDPDAAKTAVPWEQYTCTRGFTDIFGHRGATRISHPTYQHDRSPSGYKMK